MDLQYNKILIDLNHDQPCIKVHENEKGPSILGLIISH